MLNFTQLFIGTAWAAETATVAAAPVGASSTLMQYMPIFLIFIVFYFLLIRPQQKKLDAVALMLKALKKGDKVVTGGGFVGTITKVDGDDYLVVEIADGVQVKVVRSTVSGLVEDKKKVEK